MGRWSDASLGERFGPMTFELNQAFQDRYVQGSNNQRAEHTELIDPSVAGNLAIYLVADRYPGPIIHTHQDLRFHSPVGIGQSVEVTGEMVLKEMRRGKAYVAFETAFHRDGELVWEARLTSIWPEVHLRGEE